MCCCIEITFENVRKRTVYCLHAYVRITVGIYSNLKQWFVKFNLKILLDTVCGYFGPFSIFRTTKIYAYFKISPISSSSDYNARPMAPTSPVKWNVGPCIRDSLDLNMSSNWPPKLNHYTCTMRLSVGDGKKDTLTQHQTFIPEYIEYIRKYSNNNISKIIKGSKRSSMLQ